MRARCFTPSSICSGTRPARSWRISAATRARNPIRRAPRMPTTSISPPARSVSASRKPCSPRWCRTTSRRMAGWMIALVGDAEMDEGNIFEALLEGWKHGLRNTWWVVDYNRQSLDAVVREGLWEKFEVMFRNFGWDVVIVKYGRLMQAAFAEPGGEALKRWIDACPNAMYAALCFQGGAAFRKHLCDEIGDQGAVSELIDRRSDDELLELMSNLGGHDMDSMVEAFAK